MLGSNRKDPTITQEKAEALRHIFVFYRLSLNQSATFTDDEIEGIANYTYGPGGSFEVNCYFSEKSAQLLKDEGLLKLTNVYVRSPSHPKTDEKLGMIDVKKCIQEHLKNST